MHKTGEAFLFTNGMAAYLDADHKPISELQPEGWKGLHKFVKLYPEAKVNLQGSSCGLSKENVAILLKNVKETKE
jgi:hypothetical protein